jgi:DNA-binding transcriptional ArsR family regulator
VIEIETSAEDLIRTRLTYSPLWEAVCSSLALVHPERRPLHLPWIAQMMRSAKRTDLRPLWALVAPYPIVFGFLAPSPGAPGASFRDEIERLRATSPDEVQAEVGLFYEGMSEAPPTFVRPYVETPKRSLDMLATTLGVYWNEVLAPHWTPLRGVLEAEVLRNGRTLATGGVDALFGDLHPGLAWDGSRVTIDRPIAMTIRPEGRGIVVVANTFAWPAPLCGSTADGRALLVYAPRGLARLWPSGPENPEESLDVLLGSARASVLRMLDVPRATADIASMLRMGTSTVSYHLAQLRRAGLVETHRDGRRVYYRLSRIGESFLTLWSAAPEEQAMEGSDPAPGRRGLRREA